jgi:hypothetical protein
MDAYASVASKGTHIAPELCKCFVCLQWGWTLDRATELTTKVSNVQSIREAAVCQEKGTSGDKSKPAASANTSGAQKTRFTGKAAVPGCCVKGAPSARTIPGVSARSSVTGHVSSKQLASLKMHPILLPKGARIGLRYLPKRGLGSVKMRFWRVTDPLKNCYAAD